MESKRWYTSKTIVAGYVATLCGVVQLFGFTIGVQDQLTIASAAVGVTTAASGLMAVYGRYKAARSIK